MISRQVRYALWRLRSRPLLVKLAGIFAATLINSASAQAATPCLANIASPLFVPVTGALSELVFDDQCEHIYVTNRTNNTVEVFSLPTGRLQAPIQVGSAPSGIDMAPDGQTLYVANSGGNNISVVDLGRGVERLKVAVPGNFINDTPFSLAVAKSGLVLFSTTFAGSGFGGRVLQLDPATNVVSERPDFFIGGATTEATYLRASGDRSVIGALAGDISSAPVFKYSSATNRWSPEKDLNGFIRFIALDQTGATILVNPGTYVLDSNLNLAGTIAGGSFGVAVDPAGTIGYQAGPARIDVLNLTTFTKTDSLEVGDTMANAGMFGGSSVGEMAISRDGGVLAVITDHGISVIRTKASSSVTFASLTAHAQLRLRNDPKRDYFKVEGSFMLGRKSGGINLLNENATFQVGSVTINIRAGTLRASGHEFKFSGSLDGIPVHITLRARSNDYYQYVVQSDGVDLSGTSLPVTVNWVIGDDQGSVKLDSGDVEVTSRR